MPKNSNRINVNSLEEAPKLLSDPYGAIPTMGYAITAYKRSNGRTDNKYWEAYKKAITHVALNYGKEAADHLQEVAVNTSENDGDLSESLRNYSKTAIATKQPVNATVKNLLVMADDGQKPLEEWTYGFDQPDIEQSTPSKAEMVMNSIRSKIRR